MHPDQQYKVLLAPNGILEQAEDVNGLTPQGTVQVCADHAQDCWSASVPQASVHASHKADHETP